MSSQNAETWRSLAESVDVGSFQGRSALVGAGFSKNFGGYLASEFFERLMGQPQVRSDRRLQELLRESMNFEAVIDELREEPDRSSTFSSAVRSVYVAQQVALQQTRMDANLSEPFEDIFAQLGFSKTGYLFSLNQDLLLETHFCPKMEWSQFPWVRNGKNALPACASSDDREVRDRQPIDGQVTVSNNMEPSDELHGKLNIVKLHGSFNWVSSDGAEVMVIGGAKRELIERFCLLTMYAEVFRRICMTGGTKLLVIGYGFGDSHINNIILNGIDDAQLCLYVVDITSPDEKREQIKKRCLCGDRIWHGLAGYLTLDLSNPFVRSNWRYSEQKQRLDSEFFA